MGVGLAALLGGQSVAAQTHPEVLGPALVFDLTVTAALLHYFVGVRKGGLPKWTLGVVVGTGALLSVAFLPTSLTQAASLGVVLPILFEGAVIASVVLRLPRVTRAFAAKRRDGGRISEGVEAGLSAAMPFAPGVARWAVMEGLVFAYAVAGWFRRTPTGDHLFSHHRKVNWTSLALTFALLSCVEGGLVHLMLSSNGFWTAAWIAGLVHVTGLLWLLGDMHAVRLRPSRITDGTFALTLGLRADATIPLSAIQSAETGEFPRDEISKEAACATLFGTPNLRLRLSEPTEVRVLFRQRLVNEILVQVDDPQALCAALQSADDTSG